MSRMYALDLSILCRIEDKWFWPLWLIFALFTAYFLFMSYRSLLRGSAIKDTPTSKIRSAHQGYVELKGKQAFAKSGALRAKLSHELCTWYQYVIDYHNGDEWVRIEQGISTDVFALNDGTGICYIDPTGADLSTPLSVRWFGHTRYPKHGIPKGFFARIFGTKGRYRYTEWRMTQGMPLYALGNFVTLSQASFDADNQTKQINALLKKWEKRHHHLLAYLLQQNLYQTNADQKATLRYQAQQELLRETKSFMTPTFNVLSQHGLDKRQPFILSAHSEQKLMRGYQWDALIWTVGFIGLFTMTAWLMHFRLHC